LTPEDEARENRWAEEIKYFAARDVWRKRTAICPISQLTWQEWWEKKFNDDYMDYVAQKKEERLKPQTASLFDDL
jgi:hypothetical protein